MRVDREVSGRDNLKQSRRDKIVVSDSPWISNLSRRIDSTYPDFSIISFNKSDFTLKPDYAERYDRRFNRLILSCISHTLITFARSGRAREIGGSKRTSLLNFSIALFCRAAISTEASDRHVYSWKLFAHAHALSRVWRVPTQCRLNYV